MILNGHEVKVGQIYYYDFSHWFIESLSDDGTTCTVYRESGGWLSTLSNQGWLELHTDKRDRLLVDLDDFKFVRNDVEDNPNFGDGVPL